jgi:hypothetical protein
LCHGSSLFVLGRCRAHILSDRRNSPNTYRRIGNRGLRSTPQASNGIGITLTITPQTRIELAGRDNEKIDDLQIGMAVEIKYAADTAQNHHRSGI